MTDQEMADELKAKGWRVQEPLTQENCDHPHHLRMGSGGICSDGSSSMHWHCRKCGKSESWTTPARPQEFKLQGLGWN